MKKSILILLAVFMLTFVGCASTEKVVVEPVIEETPVIEVVPVRKQLYLTECALPGDGSNLLPGTFELPGTMTLIPLGGVVVEDGYAYVSSCSKKLTGKADAQSVDYLAAVEDARMKSRDAIAKFFTSNYKTGTAFEGDTQTTKAEYTTTSISFSNLSDCGYCLGPDGTIYLLSRILVSDITVLDGGYEESVFDLIETKVANLEDAVSSINEELLNK